MMRRLWPLIILALPALASADVWAPGVWATGVWATGVWAEDAAQVAVPDVVGAADFAAADAILEGDGLDGNLLAASCSAQPADEIIRQSPIAGAMVDIGSIVDVTPSSGVECTWDFTGIPSGWYSIPNVLAEQDFMREARVEANGDAVWAYYLPAAPQGSANLRLDYSVIRAEADGAATWARWAPGTNGRNTGNLQLNMVLALEANFQ